MTYEDFIKKIKEKAQKELGYPLERIKFYPAGFTSEDPQMKEWIRNSNQLYAGEENDELLTDFLVFDVPDPERGISLHRVAIRRMYEEALANGFDAAFEEISKLQKDIDAAEVDRSRLDDRSSYDYEKIREHLIIRPLNYSLYIRDLKGCVYKKVSDFVLALYQLLGDANHSLVTSKIRRDEIEKWGMAGQEEQIIQDALENTARLYPPSIYDKRAGKEENFLEKDFTKEDITITAPHNKLICLSTFKTTNGAVALFYPGVIEKMMKIMGGPFQAVFMNTNDVMIFDKKDQAAYHFAQTAKESTPMGEMLSGKQYLCDENGIQAGLVVKVYSDGKAEVEA